jgi:hypothetical protein
MKNLGYYSSFHNTAQSKQSHIRLKFAHFFTLVAQFKSWFENERFESFNSD